MKRLLVALSLVLIGFAAFAAKPKNIILLIGDGMSLPQRMAADEFARQEGRSGLVMNGLPHQAPTRSCSADSLVTDSAAAATAIACGTKTKNHYLGVDARGKRLASCAEIAKANGKRVGMVTTVTINQATPAGFYAHRTYRGDHYAIGLDLVASQFDYFAGGGMEGHNDRSNKLYKGDVYQLARDGGYEFLREDRAKFLALKPSGRKVWYVATSREMPFSIDADAWENVPTLAEMTAKGLELLENRKGFFLMIEGGKIDYACHANDAAAVLRETLAFDAAVRVATEWQKKHPDTLVIVTGDHETGGMSLGREGAGYAFHPGYLAGQICSAEAFKRHIDRDQPADFEALKPLVEKCFGLRFSGSGPMVLSKQEQSDLEQAFVYDLDLARKGKKDDDRYLAAKITHLPRELKRIMSTRSAIGWTSKSHTGLPVLTTAGGPGAERFSGYIDNTDIAKILKEFVSK